MNAATKVESVEDKAGNPPVGDSQGDPPVKTDTSQKKTGDVKDEKIGKLTEQNSNLTEALRQEREKNRGLKDGAAPKTDPPQDPTDTSGGEGDPPPGEGDDFYMTRTEGEKLVKDSVTAALTQAEQDKVKDNEKKALKEFYKKYPQYDTENDPQNLLFGKLSTKYVNRTGSSVEEIVSDLEDAHFLMNRKNQTDTPPDTIHTDSGVGPTPQSGSEPKKTAVKLTPEQQQIARSFQMSDEEYAEELEKQRITLP